MSKKLTKCDFCAHKVDLLAAQAFNRTLGEHVAALILLAREEKNDTVSVSTILEFMEGALDDACRKAREFTGHKFK